MPTLPELMERDSVTAAWFWTTSHDVTAYLEEEGFDVVFVRETNYVVGGGYLQRRTLYVQDIRTGSAHSRREHGGDIIEGDPVSELAFLLTTAADVDNNPTFGEWVRECRRAEHDIDLEGFEEMLVNFHRIAAQAADLSTWLGDSYDEYVKAAQEWAAEH